eukprot:537709-Hanusia_phi.AAC.1
MTRAEGWRAIGLTQRRQVDYRPSSPPSDLLPLRELEVRLFRRTEGQGKSVGWGRRQGGREDGGGREAGGRQEEGGR